MSATAATELNAEARRVLAASISKLYASRSQRGGLRLHRSLLLSLVMRSARDIYHSSRGGEDQGGRGEERGEERGESQGAPEPADTGAAEPQPEPRPTEEPMEEPSGAEEVCDAAEDKENRSPARQSRKRRGKLAAAPDFLPSKRARLEPGEERHAAPPPACCRAAAAADTLSALSLNRVIPAF